MSSGFIYVFRLVDFPGIYKIGMSTNPYYRLSQNIIFKNKRVKCEFVFAKHVPRKSRYEKLTHNKFSTYQVEGEFFNLSIEKLNQVYEYLEYISPDNQSWYPIPKYIKKELIKIKRTTKERLEQLAKYGDSMNDVISRLIEEHYQHMEDAQ